MRIACVVPLLAALVACGGSRAAPLHELEQFQGDVHVTVRDGQQVHVLHGTLAFHRPTSIVQFTWRDGAAWTLKRIGGALHVFRDGVPCEAEPSRVADFAALESVLQPPPSGATIAESQDGYGWRSGNREVSVRVLAVTRRHGAR